MRYIGNTPSLYVLTAIDTTSKIAFARMYTTKSSRNAKDFIQLVAYLFDYELWNTCHDNGSEFQKEFQEAIVELQLGDYRSRVKTPTDNPMNERFNRTLKEKFVDFHANLLLLPEKFNIKLMDYLAFYNTERVHFAFRNKLSPVQYMLSLPRYQLIRGQECKSGWPYTNTCII